MAGRESNILLDNQRIFLAPVAAGTTVRPADVTITAAAAAAVGDTTLTVGALAQFVPRNLVLVFDPGGADVAAIVTADAAAAATSIAIERLVGKIGQGIDTAIANAAAATWIGGLYPLAHGQQANFSSTNQTQQNAPVTFLTYTKGAANVRNKVTTVDEAIAYSGIRDPRDYSHRLVKEGRGGIQQFWLVSQVIDNDNITILEQREGLAQILNYAEPKDPSGNFTHSFDIDFIGDVTETTTIPSPV